MTRPGASERKLRLFVAVYPPADLVSAMQSRLAGLELPSHRPTPPEQVHMTLQFIGELPERELDATRECLRLAAEGIESAELAPLRLIGIPRRGPTRLIAAETDAPPSLLELQRRLAAELESKSRGRRRAHFLPHLTLCRFRTPTRMPRLDLPLSLPSFPLREVKLMQSVLRPQGALHSALASLALCQPSGGDDA